MGVRRFATGIVAALALGTLVSCATAPVPLDPRLLVGRWVFSGSTTAPEYNGSLGAGKPVQVTVTLDLRDDLTMTLTEVDHGDGVFSPDMTITYTGTWLLDNRVLRQHIGKIDRNPPLLTLDGATDGTPFDRLATVQEATQFYLRLWDESGEIRNFSKVKAP